MYVGYRRSTAADYTQRDQACQGESRFPGHPRTWPLV